MNIESRWMLLLTLTGALFCSVFFYIMEWLLGDLGLAGVMIATAFLVAILMSPTYLEVSEYWRKKYG